MRVTPNISDTNRTPEEHFKLYFLATVARVIRQCARALGTYEGCFDEYPFLSGYNDELAEYEPPEVSSENAGEWWAGAIDGWEKKAAGHLPLRAVREMWGLSHDAMLLLLCAGLPEEDARFGLLFEALHGVAGQHRPTVSLLQTWQNDGAARADVRRLRESGLLELVNLDAPRTEWAAQVPCILWDALRGDALAAPDAWAVYHAPDKLAALEALILDDETRRQVERLPRLLAQQEARAVIARGAQRNGRKTTLGALARELGLGALYVNGLQPSDDPRWRVLGPLAVARQALPVAIFDLAPGETAELPALTGYAGALGVVVGKQGGVNGPAAEQALTVTLEMPDETARKLHWQAALGEQGSDEPDAIAARFRLTGGNIRRAAKLAQAYAALDERANVTRSDVQEAARALNRQALDTLAVHVNTDGCGWEQLAANADLVRELSQLETRCRHREHLRENVGELFGKHLNAGVRALFNGPSGTGKTMAARLLAASLQMDLYRLDLSTVVNKYIGETEKNLSRIFARVEELDVILLLDEGDALLTARTAVSNSNDRYANLETNYLLQRLETFEGILLVTTNAGERIDSAFQRRMDVIVEFAPPAAAERRNIWQLHLPSRHAVQPVWLEEVVQRCALTGGQIRNAVLHAATLALSNGGTVNDARLTAAVRREYRKLGAVCPLRETVRQVSLSQW